MASGKVSGEAASLRLSLGSDLRALVQFPITLSLTGITPQDSHSVILDFSMSGMTMGLNRYRLLEQGDGQWVAEAVLPVCASGRLEWVATVSVDTHQGRISARYPFVMEH